MKKVFLWVLVILWMGLIFYYSSDSGIESTNKSRGIITKTNIIEKYQSSSTKEEKEETLEIVDIYFRKCAHASVFLVLCILICFLIKEYTLDIKKILIISFIVCFLYACSDEVHQHYVVGRSAEIRDVLIDTIGILIGNIIFYISGIKIWKKKVR